MSKLPISALPMLFCILPALSSCVENELSKITEATDSQALLIVEPMQLDYGVVQPSQTRSDVITLRNEGTEAVELLSFHLEGAGFTAASAAPLGWLAPGDSTEFWVDYTPIFVDDTGWLTVESRDSELESLDSILIPLTGQGAYPLLVLDPPLVDFGWIAPDQTASDGLFLRNGGLADLTITQTLLVGTEFAAPVEPTVPMTLAPGEEYWVDLNYAPTSLGEHMGAFWVESNSPSGTAQAQLHGGVSDKPIAVCYADPTEIAPLRGSTNWIGEDSYDPAGAQIVEYNWTLVEAPSGATARMPNGQQNRYNFVPDLAGTYVAQLIVHNEFGRASDPCITSVEAIPEESLWIEMFWTHSNDDMDLHLLAPNGALETNNDCYYMNCVAGGWLDWGTIGFSEDDPSLDIDDIPGVGPENINIYDPEDGIFEVYVHDFPSSIYSGANEVTVKIYIGGSLVYEDSKTISGENSYTRFASIEWGEEPTVVPR